MAKKDFPFGWDERVTTPPTVEELEWVGGSDLGFRI